jgi:hypothetical protein
MKKNLIAAAAFLPLVGCGLETASTAATGAAIKKQELEQGKRTMQQAQQKIDQSLQLQQQRAETDPEKEK